MSSSRRMFSAWARTTLSTSLRTPCAAPAESVMSLPVSSNTGRVVCVMKAPPKWLRPPNYGVAWRSDQASGAACAPRRLDRQSLAVEGPGPSGAVRGSMPFFVIPSPIIDPIAFEIGPLAVRWYGLAYMSGILLRSLFGRYVLSQPDLWNGKPPMTISQADDFLLWITLGIVVGGRLGFVLFYEPSYFWANPLEFPAVWNGGMSFHG